MSVCDIGSLPPEKLDWTDFGAGFVAGVTLSMERAKNEQEVRQA